MEEFKGKKYLRFYKNRFGIVSSVLSMLALFFVLWTVTDSESIQIFKDLRSLIIVVGGTFACLAFQYDLESLFRTSILVLESFYRSPERKMTPIINELDECIVAQERFTDLRAAPSLSGILIDDVVYMAKKGLVSDEIEDFIANRVKTDLLYRKLAVSLLERGAKIAPALGLLGTVIGLIDVLQQLDEPNNIGPAMSLALMTTAFGAMLGSLIFTPLAGRLANHNMIFVDVHELFMRRVSLLLRREERMIDRSQTNRQVGDYV